MEDQGSKERTIKIPVLKKGVDFRLWKNRLLGYLRTKEIVYHTQLEIQEPVLLVPLNQADGFKIPNGLNLPRELTSFPGRLPLFVKDDLVTSPESITVFHKRSRPISKDILKLAHEYFSRV